jgi:hypothetical protein
MEQKEKPQWLKDGAYRHYISTLPHDPESRNSKLSYGLIALYCILCLIMMAIYKDEISALSGWSTIGLILAMLVTGAALLTYIYFIGIAIQRKKEEIGTSLEWQKKYLSEDLKQCDTYLLANDNTVSKKNQNGTVASDVVITRAQKIKLEKALQQLMNC